MNRRGCVVGFFACSVVLLVAALLVLREMNRRPDPWGDKPRPRVVVTLPPLACFVRNVAGTDAALLCLCTDQGPADCEPTAEDEALLRRADLFLASGLGVDDRLADAQHEKARSVRFRKLSEGLPPGLGSNDGDPRVWLGISRAVVLVQRTRDELKAVDPSHAAEYDRNADRYVGELRDLEREGKKQTEKKKDRRFVSLEGPLRHFADNFGLDPVATFQLGESKEGESQSVQEIGDRCASTGGPRILASGPGFSRSATAKKLDEALSKRNVKAALVAVDPLETAAAAELGDAKWYTRKMALNLSHLLKYFP